MKWHNLTITCCLFVITWLPLHSQQLTFKNYSMQDGMISNPVRHIYQDSKGFIWFTTSEGVSRYDGHQFTNFSTANGLSFNLCNFVFEDEKGKIYVAENNGKIDQLEHDKVVKQNVFPHVAANGVWVTPQKKVLVGTDTGGIFQLHQQQLERIDKIPHNLTSELLCQWKDSIIVFTIPYTKQLKLYTAKKGLLVETDNFPYIILCIYEDRQHRLLIGTDKGIYQIELNINKYNQYEIIPKLFTKSYVALSIFQDADDNYWIGDSNKRLILQQNNGQIQIFTDKDGLPSNQVSTIFQDKENNIWLGTISGCSKIVTQNNKRIFLNDRLASAFTTEIMPIDKDNYLIACESALQLLHKPTNSFTYLLINKNQKYFNGLFSLPNNRNQIGIAGSPFIGQFNCQDKKIKLTENIVNNHYFQVKKDQQDVLVAGSFFGLDFWYKQRKYKATLKFRVSAITLDGKGSAWVGTWANGLYKVKYSIVNDSIVSTVENQLTLFPDKEVRYLYTAPNGDIWVGTRYGGVYLIREKQGKSVVINKWDYHHGLTSNYIRSITQDSIGNMWIGTILGIDKLVKTDSGYQIFNFSKSNNAFCGASSILPEADGQLWIGYDGGIMNIKDAELEKKPPTQPYITSVYQGNNKDTNYLLHENTELELGYLENQLVFEFAAPSYINEKQILYSYRLIGADDTSWNKPLNKNEISFANLQPGKYRFEVRTLGWNGNYSAPSSFAFLIHPPFWKTYWFFALCALAIAALLYALYRYRIRQLLKMQQVRNRIATDLHDDVGSSLTNISLLSELSNKNIQDPVQAKQFIQRITEEVNLSGQALDDIVWSINSYNDSFQEIVARMRRYAAEVFDGADIAYELQMEEQFAYKKLNMEQRRDLFLLFKEAVNNCYKHANASQVNIQLGMEKGHVQLIIQDNGKGFDKNRLTHRNGLKNMENRIKKWKGNIQIESTINLGTKIIVLMPIT